MVLASIQVQIDPARLDVACKAVLDCERSLRAAGHCRQWIVTQSGPGTYRTMGFYDTADAAQAAVVEVMQSLRAFGPALAEFSHREIQAVVVNRVL
jgi:hypothetical protein